MTRPRRRMSTSRPHTGGMAAREGGRRWKEESWQGRAGEVARRDAAEKADMQK